MFPAAAFLVLHVVHVVAPQTVDALHPGFLVLAQGRENHAFVFAQEDVHEKANDPPYIGGCCAGIVAVVVSLD